jgi:hypothetical protein
MAVAHGDRTYQATDLAGSNRRAFLDEAKRGIARLRDQDGMSLVMLTESTLSVLSELRTHLLAYLSLENATERSRAERRPTDFGEIAWADVLDEDDLAEFRDEYRDALSRAAASRDTDKLDEVLRAWRLTAELLRRTDAVDRINADVGDGSYAEVPRPEGEE